MRVRLALGAVVVGALVAGGTLVGGVPGDRTSAVRSDAPPQLARLALESAPYMGVSCSRPNSIACDRVRIRLSMRRPAVSVRAAVGRRTIELTPRERPRRSWEGSWRAAGLTRPGSPLRVARERGRPSWYWSGVTPVSAAVHVTALLGDGRTAMTTVRVALSPGWG